MVLNPDSDASRLGFVQMVAVRTYISRRRLLVGSTAAVLTAPLAALGITAPASELDPPTFWATVRALHEHLFPPVSGTPGVGDINATAYLSTILLDPRIDSAEREFLSRGVGLLDAYARRRHDQPFAALAEDTRETVLRKIEDNPDGQYWLSLIVHYLLEALLADPVYGGNRDGIGWRWLEHRPGTPRPPLGWYEEASGDV